MTNMKIKLLLLIIGFAAGLILQPAIGAQTNKGRRVIQPENFPRTGLPYSPGILAGGTLYLSGQLGRDPKTSKLVPGGIEAETRQILMNQRETLRAAGMDFEDVVSVTAFLTDFKEFDAYNKVYREFFPKDPPARATVGVSALNVGARIELQMIAAK
jgi:2-iminobutanoate/2-iminopropanoate deaminase